ncbi:UDP-N-acetyl-D-glucosamine dehydrogenase [Peribacillus simplex NBRC 15720 = DSM 1321]|uniref:UDP-N-acetyl-D-glucosamine dehydrogenase n=2 Tax=Peribacillus simplex TaxID=1478 RepID=A0A223ENJ0_9BACI|nr:UDP-N-acetyl-D-glucosamine dehydrogenase [Peribacillus simplex NBRC 15720 = DSM 1321]
MQMLKTNSKTVAIIGLGYVGLPLSLLFLSKNFQVVGIDLDIEKINKLEGLTEFQKKKVKDALIAKKFIATSNYDAVRDVDIVVICVPTPLNENGKPNLSYIIDVGNKLQKRLQKGQLIILESSSYPGTTRDVLTPILEKSGLMVGKDIFVSYSPERIDPGNLQYKIEEIPKIISGMSNECLNKAEQIYSKVFDHVIKVSSPEIAEMAKILENSYRFINISFIDEMAILCDYLKIDIWEVIESASTKPFGFSPFNPGPGIGGHCIPVDPLFLQWKLEETGMKSEFIGLAEMGNEKIQNHIVSQIEKINDNTLVNKEILICGVTYKKDSKDIRNSPAIQIIESLLRRGATVSFYDPFINELILSNKIHLISTPITKKILNKADCVIILTDHSSLPIDNILKFSKLIYDTRNMTSNLIGEAKVIRLGGGEWL